MQGRNYKKVFPSLFLLVNMCGLCLIFGCHQYHDKELDNLFKIGLNLQKDRKYADAVEYYDKILKQTPNDCNVLFNKAMCLSMISRNKDALHILQKCIKYYPDQSTYHVHAAGCTLQLWQLQEALAHAKDGIATAKNKREKLMALSKLSDIYYAMNEPHHYMKLIEECAALDPCDDVIVSNYIVMLLECPDHELRNLQKAQKLAERLVDKCQNSPRAWFALEKVLLASGDVARAKEANQRALNALREVDNMPLYMETDHQLKKDNTGWVSLRQLVERSSMRYNKTSSVSLRQ